MHYFVLGVILFLSLALESTLFDRLTFYMVKPDLLLITVLIYALFRGSVAGARLGFVYGLLEDLLLGRFVGLNAASKMLTGYLVGLGERRFFKDNIAVPILVIFGGTFVSHIFYVLFSTVVSGQSQFNFFSQHALPFAIYNGVMGLIFYKPFSKYLKAEEARIKYK